MATFGETKFFNASQRSLMSKKDFRAQMSCWNFSINFNGNFLFSATAAIYIKNFQCNLSQCLLVPWEINFLGGLSISFSTARF